MWNANAGEEAVMVCELIVIVGVWINSCDVRMLMPEEKGKVCVIFWNDGDYMVRRVRMPCPNVAKIINEAIKKKGTPDAED